MLAGHKKQSLLLVGFFVLALCEQGWAQEGNALRRPEDLSPYDKCLGPQGSTRSKEFWRVWADRENVPVFSDETLTTTTPLKLKFLEPFYVAQVNSAKTAMLLIRSKSEPFDTTIVKEGNPIGWVKAENLLLNTSAARTDTFIPKRAFIINDWKEFNDATKEEVKSNQVTVRAAPSASATALRTISGSDIFSYLYKYDQCSKPGWFLVASRVGLTRFNGPEEIITGWIPKSRAAEWDTREAFEPVPDRKVPADVFRTEAAMKANNRNDSFMDAMQRDRWASDKWRYVLMSQSPDKKEAKVGYLGDLKVIDEAKAAATTADPKLSKTIQEFYGGALTHVNIIFVMDGTASMGDYIQMVANTADRIGTSLKGDTEDIKVTYGAVVYRDRQNPPKERYDTQPPSPSIQDVTRFLRAQKEPTPGDTDFEEALFGGLEIALGEVAEKDKQNIVIIVGDAGNSDVKQPFNETAIRKALAGKYVQLYALHIQRPSRSPAEAAAIAKFEPDMQKLFGIVASMRSPARQAMVEQYPKSSEPLPDVKATVLERTAANQEDIKGVGDKIGVEIRKTIKTAAAMLEVYAACIDQGFDKCSTADASLGMSSGSASNTGGSLSLYEVKASLLDLLAQEVADPALLRAMIRDKVQIFQPGWVKLTDPSGAPIMRPVYLVSQDELLTARGLLTEFGNYGGSDAVGLVRIWKGSVEQACGCNTDNPDEYLQMRSGLAFKSLSGFLSREWDELQKARPDEISNFLKLAKAATERLDKLRYDDSIWFKNYGQKFAWIAAADLP